jgi:myosin heavy subunit
MARKQGAGGSASSPRSSVDSARPSVELAAAEKQRDDEVVETPPTELATDEKKDEDEPTKNDREPTVSEAPETATTEFEATPAVGETVESTEQVAEIQASNTTTNASKEEVVSLIKEVEELKTRQQEEIQEYIERIDSLQLKLQYLSKTAAESAKQTATSSPSGSTERKIAEKDEKIALLMEEGHKLATGEQKYRSIIKKLRQQIANNEKQTEELKKGKEKAVSEAAALRNQLTGSEEKEKRQEEARRATAGLQKEIDGLKKEKSSQEETIKKLERDLRNKTEEANNASTLSSNLAAEREKTKAHEEEYSVLASEKEALAEKSRQDVIEWSEKLDRAVERGRATEAELKVELKAMETKLEAMRSQAEEVTSGSGGEAQIKLLRQIETLQSQYASASHNWQGIEASLLTKVSNLEKERDEAQKRESEMRKKARDAVCGLSELRKYFSLTSVRLPERVTWTRSFKMPSLPSPKRSRSWINYETRSQL